MHAAFASSSVTPTQPKYTAQHQAPSNIALVKYWGKHGEQLPANPSISFTLDHCRSITKMTAKTLSTPTDHISFEVNVDGTPAPHFAPKIATYLDRIKPYCPWLPQFHFTIDTSNTFPHSSGIASSASGMAALSCCVLDLEQQLGLEVVEHKASFLARLGSGSASRSLDGPLIVWGEHPDVPTSSDLYAVDTGTQMHEIFAEYRDTILLVDVGTKAVSSTVGHGLMKGHAFAKARFEQAPTNLTSLLRALQTGDLEKFIEITESEALTLHAMMMASTPYFMLMKPNTLRIIEAIWELRATKKLPVCFTLDAGANVHLLYPKNIEQQVHQFIDDELAQFCHEGRFIHDRLGAGASPV